MRVRAKKRTYSEAITLKIEPLLFDRIRELADENNASISDICRSLMAAGLEHQKHEEAVHA